MNLRREILDLMYTLQTVASDGLETKQVATKIGVMYDELLKISRENLKYQLKYLKESIDKVMNSEDKNESGAVKTMINFKEMMVCDPNIGLRQDTIVDIESGKELLSFPNVTTYDIQTLKKIQLSMPKTANLNIFDHFDANAYLGVFNCHFCFLIYCFEIIYNFVCVLFALITFRNTNCDCVFIESNVSTDHT